MRLCTYTPPFPRGQYFLLKIYLPTLSGGPFSPKSTFQRFPDAAPMTCAGSLFVRKQRSTPENHELVPLLLRGLASIVPWGLRSPRGFQGHRFVHQICFPSAFGHRAGYIRKPQSSCGTAFRPCKLENYRLLSPLVLCTVRCKGMQPRGGFLSQRL